MVAAHDIIPRAQAWDQGGCQAGGRHAGLSDSLGRAKRKSIQELARELEAWRCSRKKLLSVLMFVKA